MPFFGQNGHLQMSLKKSEVWVSKKCLKNECELHICSKCISIMFLWCFGSHWYALLMVKFFFCLWKFICKSSFLKLFCSFQLKLTLYFKGYLAWVHKVYKQKVYILLEINAIPRVAIPNTQKFWSDRKSSFTDIFDIKKDTIKHDRFWDTKSSCILFILCWLVFLKILGYWVLGIGYWVMGIWYCVLSVGYRELGIVGFGY